MTKARKKYLILGLLTVAVLVFLVIDAWKSGFVLVRPDWGLVAIGASLTILFPFCMALRWGAILWAAGSRVGFREAVSATMAVWPLGTITPSKSGELAKALCVREKVDLATGLGSVVTERALDVIILLLFSFGGALALGEQKIAILSGLGLAAGLGGWAFVALGFHLPVGPKLTEKLERFGKTARILLTKPGYLLTSASASALNWFLSILQTYLFYKAFGVEVSLLFVCAALPVAIFVGLLPVTLMGAGTRDKALIELFAPMANASVSLSVGVLYTLCGYILPSLVGIPFMRKLVFNKSDQSDQSDTEQSSS